MGVGMGTGVCFFLQCGLSCVVLCIVDQLCFFHCGHRQVSSALSYPDWLGAWNHKMAGNSVSTKLLGRFRFAAAWLDCQILLASADWPPGRGRPAVQPAATYGFRLTCKYSDAYTQPHLNSLLLPVLFLSESSFRLDSPSFLLPSFASFFLSFLYKTNIRKFSIKCCALCEDTTCYLLPCKFARVQVLQTGKNEIYSLEH